MTTVRNLTAAIESLWPIAGQEEWDASGPISGDPDALVKSVLCVVDVTHDTVTEAIEGKYDALVAHHPLLLRSVTSLYEDRYKGELLGRLIRANCALMGVHTNGDRVPSGTSATLAAAIGLDDATPLVPHSLGGGTGIRGRISPRTLVELATSVAAALPSTAGGVKVAGEGTSRVETIALCAGAGDSLLGLDAVRSADVYITSDLRHHPASEFREQARLDKGTALIDISHWAAEWLWLDNAARQLGEQLPGIRFVVSEINTDPWTFAVVQ